ncbi:MAG: hypothetical protein KC931_13865 [Candidatus Omnitrophica bacterium]|nr:hypothetical protein [Candidatus Omnitrophota bacterium]MCA9430803.1 hypothetical protein [Candidatus Omnitrophota bacterium]MCA9436303.1 hypothetical protein [Candidatus Omnitrophota bacterium]MCA9443190.1 hypothetical protein [Candidatus Omnitrophota bacterium]MCA9448200.1 hypothetical protein [Candidatus Omnitrophota bacterium]
MGVFEMIAVIVIAGIISEMYKARLDTRAKIEGQSGELKELIQKIESIESRLGSLEELTLEREKERRFDDISR